MIKTITTVREYDEQGRVVKETTTEVEHTAPSPFPVEQDSGDWWRLPRRGWWQDPVVSWLPVRTSTTTTPYTINA